MAVYFGEPWQLYYSVHEYCSAVNVVSNGAQISSNQANFLIAE